MRSRTVTVNCQAKCDATRVTQIGRNLWRCAAGAKNLVIVCARMRVVAEDAPADCLFLDCSEKISKNRIGAAESRTSSCNSAQISNVLDMGGRFSDSERLASVQILPKGAPP